MSNCMNVILDKGAYEPIRAHETDAGLDLRTPVDMEIAPGESAVVDTGVHVEIPIGFVGMLKSKSGLNVKKGILSEGVIDSGYTGSIVVKLYNHGKETVRIKAGDKVTQLVILPIITPRIVYTDRFSDTDRGDHGFGSTGR